MKSRHIFLAFILCMLVLCMSACSNNAISYANAQGNSNGNIHNGGIVLADGEWIYYTNFAENNSLYKMKRDGQDKTELQSGHYSFCLNKIGEWIYYTNGIPGSIWKINIQNKTKKMVVNNRATNLLVTSHYIFYIKAEDKDWGKLYRTDLDGRNRTLLADRIDSFALDENWIYYSNREDDNGSLYKMNFDGYNKVKLNNARSSDINPFGSYVYYTDNNQNLYRVDKNGENCKLLSKEQCWDINVYDSNIFYRNQSQNGYVFRMNIDGTNNSLYVKEENCTNINVIDQFLVYNISVAGKTGVSGYFKVDLSTKSTEQWS